MTLIISVAPNRATEGKDSPGVGFVNHCERSEAAFSNNPQRDFLAYSGLHVTCSSLCEGRRRTCGLSPSQGAGLWLAPLGALGLRGQAELLAGLDGGAGPHQVLGVRARLHDQADHVVDELLGLGELHHLVLVGRLGGVQLDLELGGLGDRVVRLELELARVDVDVLPHVGGYRILLVCKE